MSFFGTLRRSKGKRGPDEREMPSKNIIFNSTPNLHKIENKDKLTSLVASGSSVTSVRSHSPGMNRPSPSPHVSRKLSTEPPSANSTPGTPKRRGSFGISSPVSNIRHFVSMMSMVNSLKRSTSSRKLAFGSAMHLNTKEGGEREERTMIKKSSSKSEEKLCHKFELLHKNLEPGVTSSSSSSISSDLGSLSGGRGSIRNSSERTDIPEEESDDELEKTPEEIEKETFILQGIKKFNMDPKKGVEFLVSKELIQNTAESIAQFLKVGEGLSKTAIGNYLGERIDFNEDVLRAFVELHDFTDVILVQALRQFLWSFRLPGEAQKIDRMMEAFAKRYCQLNPGIFSNTDTCYVLSYAIIMLNTTLHNRNVKDKPTVEQFIRMNRDIDGGKALNTEFIASLYNSIQSEPFKIPPEDGNDLMLTFFNPNIEGWLWKQGGRYKSWKRRWFILSNNCLYYFKFTADKTPRGIIPLENIIVKAEKSGKPFAFCLVKESLHSHLEYIKTCKTLSDGTIAPGQYSSIHLAAFNQREREKWIKTISNNNSLSQFYSDLTLKKRKAEEKSKNKHVDKKDKLAVRKSQISLPSTVAGVENHIILPDEIYADPRKNPHNFFVEKNVRPVIQHYDDTDSLSLEQEHHRNDRDLGLGSSVGSFDVSQSASLKSDENYDCDSVSFDLNTSSAHFEDDVDKALESNLSRSTSICESDDERLVPEPNYCRPDFKRLSRIEESYRNSSLLDSPPISKVETFVPSFTLLKERSLEDSDHSHLPSPTVQDIRIVHYEEDPSTELEETNNVCTRKESFDSTESTAFYYVVDNSGSVNLTQRSNYNCVLGRTRLKSPPYTSKEILMECDTAMTPISGQPLGLVVSGVETPDGVETADDSTQVSSKSSDVHEDSVHLTDLTTQYESSV